MFQYIALFVIISLVSLYAYFKWVFTYWNRWDIPTLDPKFPFGDFHNLFTRKISRFEELRDLHFAVKKKGYKYVGLYQLLSPTWLITDLDVLKKVCISDFDHFFDRNFYYNEKDDPIGAHLLSLEGNRWKRARSLTTTVFTTSKLRAIFSNLVECTGPMLECIDSLIENNKQPINIKSVLSSFTADGVGAAVFGIKCKCFEDPDKNFVRYGHRALEMERSQQVKFLIGNMFPEFARFLKFPQVSKDVGKFFTKVMSETIQKRKDRGVERNDFLHLLMNLHENDKSLTLNEVIALSFGFFIGGFETSSTTLSFCLFHLGMNQEYQDKLRKEIKETLAKHKGEITVDCISEMTYLKQVLDETLRLWPPVHAILRVCTKDYKVPGENLVIEKGIKVTASIPGIHRDPENFERPNEFYPDHFSEENRKKLHSYAFIPFGIGPRNCIGGRYAMLQLRLVVTVIISRYRVFVDTNKTKIPLKLSATSIVPVAEGGLWLNLEKI